MKVRTKLIYHYQNILSVSTKIYFLPHPKPRSRASENAYSLKSVDTIKSLPYSLFPVVIHTNSTPSVILLVVVSNEVHVKTFLFPRNFRINSTTYIELPDKGQCLHQEGRLMYCNMTLLLSLWLTWSGEHGISLISHTQSMAIFIRFYYGQLISELDLSLKVFIKFQSEILNIF